LAKLAIDLGVADIALKGNEVEVLEGMQASENGKKWLEAFHAAREPWFYVSTGTGWYHHDKCWNDDLDVPLSAMGIYIEKIRKGDNIDRPTKNIIAERERLATEYRALLSTDADRQTYDQLLGTARTVFPYVENHLFYVEHWFHSLFWNKIREVGKILVDYKLIEDVEDVWY